MTDILRPRALPNEHYQHPNETDEERERRLARIRTNPDYSFNALVFNFRQHDIPAAAGRIAVEENDAHLPDDNLTTPTSPSSLE